MVGEALGSGLGFKEKEIAYSDECFGHVIDRKRREFVSATIRVRVMFSQLLVFYGKSTEFRKHIC